MTSIAKNQNIFDQVFSSAPPMINKDKIQAEWLAIKPPLSISARRLPLPVWARRGLTDSGAKAWCKLDEELIKIGPTKAYCIYIHIPFCANKCAFCDCYSFRLSQHRCKNIDAYIACLEQEMALWNRKGSLAQRPVSTVHFGGGTPTLLGEVALRRVVQSCKQYFRIGQQTEWALETTSSELDDNMFTMLDSLGFTRLHLGVQSLEDPIRRLIGRREPASIVLEKLSYAISLGWITSVDLIYGLPTQSLTSLLQDIDSLSNIGIDGFSLYELQRSIHNRTFIEQNGLVDRDRTHDYLYLHAASQLLESLGYRKTLFNHFARERDTNLYFSFPERGEDCLALGTIADGVFNDYHYRHPEYASYCKAITPNFPGLLGGVRNNARESLLAPLEVAILSGKISVTLFTQILGDEFARTLLKGWLESALIERENNSNEQFLLTANGSWFSGEMLAQLAEI